MPENVRFESGKAFLAAHGNLYKGDVMGVGKGGRRLASGVRTGACLVSKKRLHFGSYEVRMKVAPVMGCCSALWTFRYEETGSGVLNHEIDIEMPGRPGPKHEGIGFDYALCNTWIGEEDDKSTIRYTKLPKRVDDGEFHDFRIDWHWNRVDYFVDGVKVNTNRSHVPNMPGEFWVGVWFPRGWTGTPDFDTAEAVVEDFKFTPYEDETSRYLEATAPEAGEKARQQASSIRAGRRSPTPSAGRSRKCGLPTKNEIGRLAPAPRPARLAWRRWVTSGLLLRPHLRG